jgi:hypothetical protein
LVNLNEDVLNENILNVLGHIKSLKLPFDSRLMEKFLYNKNKKFYYFRTIETSKFIDCESNQKSKTQVSAFTNFNKDYTVIFKGASGRLMDFPMICVLYGNVSMGFNKDVFSEKDMYNRMWIDPIDVSDQNHQIMVNIQESLKKNFLKKIQKKFKISYIEASQLFHWILQKYYHSYEVTTQIIDTSSFTDKTLGEIIKFYFVAADEAYKKHKKDLEKIYMEFIEYRGPKGLSLPYDSESYNEVFAYNYEIKELILTLNDYILETLTSMKKFIKTSKMKEKDALLHLRLNYSRVTDNIINLYNNIEYMKKKGYKINIVGSKREIPSILQKYIKKNKELK